MRSNSEEENTELLRLAATQQQMEEDKLRKEKEEKDKLDREEAELAAKAVKLEKERQDKQRKEKEEAEKKAAREEKDRMDKEKREKEAADKKKKEQEEAKKKEDEEKKKKEIEIDAKPQQQNQQNPFAYLGMGAPGMMSAPMMMPNMNLPSPTNAEKGDFQQNSGQPQLIYDTQFLIQQMAIHQQMFQQYQAMLANQMALQ